MHVNAGQDRFKQRDGALEVALDEGDATAAEAGPDPLVRNLVGLGDLYHLIRLAFASKNSTERLSCVGRMLA
jgi:hypothetical protein